ncbi:MAG: DUF1566 domain-containing protein [Saprospiraceae bacterium]|nr:DUF1566 domain-containing protein [Saprospiraceae bacterium]
MLRSLILSIKCHILKGRSSQLFFFTLALVGFFSSVSAQNTGIRIDKNSVLGGLDGAQILLFENEDDFARLRMTNNLFEASTNNRYWDIAGRIGSNSSGLGDRLNIYLHGYGDILSLHGDGQVHFNGRMTISVLDTINDLSTNVVVKDDGTLAIRKYEIGDSAHAGLVFWVDQSGEHGLVCSFTDLQSSTNDMTPHWSTDITNYTGATGGKGTVVGIEAGMTNTTLIISADPADLDAAARLCADLLDAGVGDWYLPSQGELDLIYQGLFLNGLGTFALGYYWSSTEDSANASMAWGCIFFDGTRSTKQKDGYGRVRAIRAF